jgi:hypothetical protein
MIQRPLACPVCRKNDWSVLRAADTGALALECDGCKALVRFGLPRDVPTLDRPAGEL